MTGLRRCIVAAACSGLTLAAQAPPDLPALLSQAQADIRQGHDDEARRIIGVAESRIKDAPEADQLPARLQLGNAYLLLGEARQAQQAFSEVVLLARRRGSLADEGRGAAGLGRSAIKAHDPERAIAYLQRAVEIDEQLRPGNRGEAPYEWLAAALMMQSASPGDEYVERAFSTAAHRTRADVAATLENGQAHVQYLVGEENAYAWVLTRERIIGFELPPPAMLAINVDRAVKYIDDHDRDGLDRISEELTPAVLGPIIDALPSLRRIMIVPDGALTRLPFATLRVGDRYLGERVAVSVADANGRQVVTPVAMPDQHSPSVGRAVVVIALGIAATLAVVTISRRARRRSPSRS